MSGMQVIPVDATPLELLTRLAEAIRDFSPEEREAIVRTLRELSAPRFITKDTP